jgi:hypothetical protein
MSHDIETTDGHVDPQAILQDAEAREKAADESLASIRELYHAGTQPLTVAQAKVSIIRRGIDPETGERVGEWHRKQP